MDAELKREFTRIHNAIADIRARQVKENWVTGAAIMKLTGWDPNTLLVMRRNGLVTERKSGKKVRYLVQSIPDIAFQKNQNSQIQSP